MQCSDPIRSADASHPNGPNLHRQGLNLLLPSVLEDLAFAKDKRAGLGHFVHQVPLWSMGVPDSCGYIGMHYCQVDAVPIFAKWGVCVPQECTIQVRLESGVWVMLLLRRPVRNNDNTVARPLKFTNDRPPGPHRDASMTGCHDGHLPARDQEIGRAHQGQLRAPPPGAHALRL